MSKAFIPYIMCGDPDLETSEKLIASLVEAGADAIELGIPFSDPVAEGPVIQAASSRALQQNVDANALFSLVEKVRKTYT
ncbi:tryptophan synthase subunit alpha, partial [Dubosiella newyorkensis]